MFKFFLRFFQKENTCLHEKITPDMECGYCPDCGEFVENQWYIIRCSCCGIKEKATIINGEIVPITKYCKNCGSNKFVVEKLKHITPFDLYFAVLVTKVVTQRPISFIQTWVEAKEEKINRFLTDRIIKF